MRQGVAKILGEAGAIRKSLTDTELVDSVVLLLAAVLESFCWAQSGSAIRALIATIRLHLRIVSSVIEPENPMNSLRHPFINLSYNAGWRRRTVGSKPLASPNWGRFPTSLANN